MKDRQKKYCAESGLPSQEEIDDYHRLQLLKDVEENMKFLKLNKGDKKQQLIMLKAIEKTPDQLPEPEYVREYFNSQREAMSMRKKRIDSHSVVDGAVINKTGALSTTTKTATG